MKPLNPYENDVDDSVDLSFAGNVITDEIQAFDFAIGNINFSGKKLEKITDFDPENAEIVATPCYGKRAHHSSIWHTRMVDDNEYGVDKEDAKGKAENARLKIQSCFSSAPNTKEENSRPNGIQEKSKDGVKEERKDI